MLTLDADCVSLFTIADVQAINNQFVFIQTKLNIRLLLLNIC